jgi:hypothetical protein
MMGPSLHVHAIEARPLFGREHRANLVARRVHDRAQGVPGSFPEAVDLHTTAREYTVDARTLQRIEPKLLAEMTIALRAEWRMPTVHRHVRVARAKSVHPRIGDHPRGEHQQKKQSDGDSPSQRS